MKVCRRGAKAPVISCTTLLAVLFVMGVDAVVAPQGAAQVTALPCRPAAMDSPYIPVDSWVYPAVLRLYGLGFVDDVFLGIRPYTRASLSNMLDAASARIQDADPGPETDQAEEIYEALMHELRYDIQGPCAPHEGNSRLESVYSIERAISGRPSSTQTTSVPELRKNSIRPCSCMPFGINRASAARMRPQPVQ